VDGETTEEEARSCRKWCCWLFFGLSCAS